MEQLANWARIDQRKEMLATQLANKRTERQQLKSAIGDPAISVRDTDQKWADASLRAIRVDAAARIASGAGRLAAFNTIPAHSDRFKRAIGNSFRHLRGWACTALTADSNFPLESGLFDLMIIDDQDARPEQVDEPGLVIQLAYMLLIARNGPAPHTEDLEERVIEALRLTLLVGCIPPLVGESGSAGTHRPRGLTNGKAVALCLVAAELALKCPVVG